MILTVNICKDKGNLQLGLILLSNFLLLFVIMQIKSQSLFFAIHYLFCLSKRFADQGFVQQDNSKVRVDQSNQNNKIGLLLIMIAFSKRFAPFCTTKYFKDTSFKNVTAIANDTPGALSRLCNVFASYGVNLTYLRTHWENRKKGDKVKYRIEISLDGDHHYNFDRVKEDLKTMAISLNEADPIIVPWFPRTRSDLDKIGETLLTIDPKELEERKGHPQFHDPEYRRRRDKIASIGKQYKMGQKIPEVEYTPEEHELWRNICRKVAPLQRQAMSHRFLALKQELEKEVQLSQRIPQLCELAEYLEKRTGFTIKPVPGILSQREFLNCLAFKVFCSTQYIRHVSCPDYTPEPDIVHEFLGHIATFADPAIAELSQTIGLLSLGASDEEVAKLGTLYLFTLQFGACKENGQMKSYGAGVAGSVGELQYFMGRAEQKPRFQKLDIFRDCTASFPVTSYQPVYKVNESFEEAAKDLERYGRSIMKPITTVIDEENNKISYDRSIEAVYYEDTGLKF